MHHFRSSSSWFIRWIFRCRNPSHFTTSMGSYKIASFDSKFSFYVHNRRISRSDHYCTISRESERRWLCRGTMPRYEQIFNSDEIRIISIIWQEISLLRWRGRIKSGTKWRGQKIYFLWVYGSRNHDRNCGMWLDFYNLRESAWSY